VGGGAGIGGVAAGGYYLHNGHPGEGDRRFDDTVASLQHLAGGGFYPIVLSLLEQPEMQGQLYVKERVAKRHQQQQPAKKIGGAAAAVASLSESEYDCGYDSMSLKTDFKAAWQTRFVRLAGGSVRLHRVPSGNKGTGTTTGRRQGTGGGGLPEADDKRTLDREIDLRHYSVSWGRGPSRERGGDLVSDVSGILVLHADAHAADSRAHAVAADAADAKQAVAAHGGGAGAGAGDRPTLVLAANSWDEMLRWAGTLQFAVSLANGGMNGTLGDVRSVVTRRLQGGK
jgi:hypothetical protein